MSQSTWRPAYHVTAERNWMNDPNGPIYHDGRYHLFFQSNPEAPFWGPPRWGHVSSDDLVHWERQAEALTPGAGGPDADGCWSGCATVVDGRPAIYYTGVVGDGDDRVESVCRAWGDPELRQWRKDRANPLIPGPPAELDTGYHRDPYLWHDGERWNMLLGGGTSGGQPHGRVLRYVSDDASAWEYAGVFFSAPPQLDGVDLGEHWECPQLLWQGGRVALILSCQRPGAEFPLMHAVAFTGEITAEGTFNGSFAGRLDGGDVYYAPAVSTGGDGEPLLWGWAQERVPAEVQSRMAHVGALALPRRVRVIGDRLSIESPEELDALRAGAIGTLDSERRACTGASAMELSGEVSADAPLSWRITGEEGEVEIRVDPAELVLRVVIHDQFRSNNLSQPVPDGAAGRRLRVRVDGSLVEADMAGAFVTSRCYGLGAGPRVRIGEPWSPQWKTSVHSLRIDVIS